MPLKQHNQRRLDLSVDVLARHELTAVARCVNILRKDSRFDRVSPERLDIQMLQAHGDFLMLAPATSALLTIADSRSSYRAIVLRQRRPRPRIELFACPHPLAEDPPGFGGAAASMLHLDELETLVQRQAHL